MDSFLFGATALASTVCLKKNYNETAQQQQDDDLLHQKLLDGTSLNADERICIVTADNVPIIEGGGCLRATMRLENRWHRATYIVIRHEAPHVQQHEDTYILVQRRSKRKDYCPGKLDPTPGGVVGYNESYRENAVREIQEEMGIDVVTNTGTHCCSSTLERLFTFPYQDNRVRVWGDFYECVYHGALKDLHIQKEEVEEVIRMPLQEVADRMESHPSDFMPDACHAMKLYLQRQGDLKVTRRLLKGYSSSNLDSYSLRPKPQAIFFDCDDTLYFDNWTTANKLTKRIDEWCVAHGLRPGQAYELYKQYGTALRGLLAEGYLEDSEAAIDAFLQNVHDINVQDLLPRDDELRVILSQMDETIPKYIFTASVSDHARRCLQALGIDDLFDDTIIDCKMCNFESKHAEHSFRVAMQVAGVSDPERCLFLDDNLTNLFAARQIGWRCVLVGRVGRDCGTPVSSEHAELEMDRIHDAPQVLPELFLNNNNNNNNNSSK